MFRTLAKKINYSLGNLSIKTAIVVMAFLITAKCCDNFGLLKILQEVQARAAASVAMVTMRQCYTTPLKNSLGKMSETVPFRWHDTSIL
jgi:uncharacterized membrane protein YdcZ (DUF606 family)